MKKEKRVEQLEDRIDMYYESLERQKFLLEHQKEEIFHTENMLKLLKRQLKQLTN